MHLDRAALVLAFTAFAHLVAPPDARAHLMPPDHATVHVVGNSVFSVVWLPASALDGVPLEADGTVRQASIEARQAAVVANLRERFRLFDGAEPAETIRLDLILQPPDDAPPARGDRADQLVMLHHARFAHEPGALRLDTDLVARRGPGLSVNATNDRLSEVVTLPPGGASHVFFGDGHPGIRAKLRAALSSPIAPVVGGVWLAGLVLGTLAVLWRRRLAARRGAAA